ncbi:MAG: hypothetical protein K2X35_09350 [Bryobacteraceae bacterium]|nr:hypothetical protein [Bryobacteraceae bacterium]
MGILEFRVAKERLATGYGWLARSPSSAILATLRKDLKPLGFPLSRPHCGSSGDLQVRCMAGGAFIEIALRLESASGELLVRLEASGYPGLLGPSWHQDLQVAWAALSQAVTVAVQRRFSPPSVRRLPARVMMKSAAVPDFAG